MASNNQWAVLTAQIMCRLAKMQTDTLQTLDHVVQRFRTQAHEVFVKPLFVNGCICFYRPNLLGDGCCVKVTDGETLAVM